MPTIDRRRLIAVALAALPAAARADPAPDLAVGQAWTMRGAPATVTARVIIARIEPGEGGKTVVSVSVIGLHTDEGETVIAHLPFEQGALAASLGEVTATGVAPPAEFEAAYQQWKTAHGRIFALPVAEVVMTLLNRFSQGGGAPPATNGAAAP